MKKIAIDGIIYGIREHEVIVCGLDKKYPEAVHIEETIQEKPVVEIRAKAFVNSDIVQITLPQTICLIGKRAFWGCKHLESVIGMPTSFNHLFHPNVHAFVILNEEAFANCVNLQKVEFTDPLRYVATSAFENCEKLATMNVLLGTIRKNAFKNCSALKQLQLAANNYLASGSIEESGISEIVVSENFSYTKQVEKHLREKPVLLRCPNFSDVNDMVYFGFIVTTS